MVPWNIEWWSDNLVLCWKFSIFWSNAAKSEVLFNWQSTKWIFCAQTSCLLFLKHLILSWKSGTTKVSDYFTSFSQAPMFDKSYPADCELNFEKDFTNMRLPHSALFSHQIELNWLKLIQHSERDSRIMLLIVSTNDCWSLRRYSITAAQIF